MKESRHPSKAEVVVQIRGGVAEIVFLAPGIRAEVVDYDNDSSTIYCGRMDSVPQELGD